MFVCMLKSVCVDSNELNLSFLSNKTNNLGMDVFGLLKPFYIIHGQNYFSTSHATHSLNSDPDAIYVIIFLNVIPIGGKTKRLDRNE